MRYVPITAVLGVVGLLASPIFGVTMYSVTTIPTLGGTSGTATGINNSGEVTGMASLVGDTTNHGYIDNNGTMTDILPLAGTGSQGNSINDSGQVAGTSAFGVNNTPVRAILASGAIPINLGTLGGSDSVGYGINNSGWVVGYARNTGPNSGTRAFLYNGVTMQNLGTLGGSDSVASGINSAGWVVGSSTTVPGQTAVEAFLYNGTQMLPLGTFVGGGESEATSINDNNLIAGDARLGNGDSHAFLYDGTMHDLGTLGGAESFSDGINNAGDIVGASDISGSSDLHAFLYDGSTMIDLNNQITPGSGWELNWAFDINDSGQIVGNGTLDGQTRGFLLTPIPNPIAVPEPLTASLWLLGAAGIAVVLCRRIQRIG